MTFQTLPDAGGEYTPRCITIARGQSVTIQASGGTTFQSHNMSQRCGPVGNLFTQKTGSSKTITFNTAGDYGYYCDFHPGSAMSGSIRVQ
ncbi:MAG: cupredoxin domain-containing protein [Myxococcaceae bacterium]